MTMAVAVSLGTKNGAASTRTVKVALAVPYYNAIEGEATGSWDRVCGKDSPHSVERLTSGHPFLAANFNNLWCYCLNARPRHDEFVMSHVDVDPHGLGWIDGMVAERKRSGADLLSVCLPIKDKRRLCSTAAWNVKTGKLRRLTMKEVWASRTPTFDAQTLGLSADWKILGSTGLWVCNFRDSWVEKVFFSVRDRIVRRADGQFANEMMSEDHGFSIQLHKLGLKVMATRAIAADHIGKYPYSNQGPEPWEVVERDAETPDMSWSYK